MKKLKNIAYSRFRVSILIQVIFIAVVPAVIFWLIFRKGLILTSTGLFIIWILQIIYLNYYLNRVNRDLSRFLYAFRYEDSNMIFSTKSEDALFKDLHKGFNSILNSFEKIKLEKQKDFIFFKNAIEHVGIGLLSFKENGDIILSNKAFKYLSGIYSIRNIYQLSTIKPDLPDLIQSMKNGEQKLVKTLINKNIVHLSIKYSGFSLGDEIIAVVSFQDIKNEIEQNEMDAWQKLIRVLTHEIMNSVSPVTLLSNSLIQLFEKDGKNKKPDELSEDQIIKLLRGLHTINRRSKGLSRFVEDYRNLTQLSPPEIVSLPVDLVFRDIETLFREELKSKDIELRIIFPKNITIAADKELLEQVIINLVKNSVDAVKGTANPVIELACFQKKEHTVITVTDNGKGISEEIMGNIFVPFFSTKKDGSGIGLSLSRQIMRLHNGLITVESKEKESTVFSLVF